MTETDFEELKAKVEELETLVNAHETDLNNAYTLAWSGAQDDDSIEKTQALTVTVADINKQINRFCMVKPAWSYEPFNTALDKAYAISDVSKTNAATTRTYPLVMKWGTKSHTLETGTENSTYWFTETWTNIIPEGIASGYIIIPTSNWGGTDFTEQHLRYSVSGRDISVTGQVYVDRSDQKSKTYSINMSFLLIGKSSSGGGQIG